MSSITIYLCPCCPAKRSTRKEIVAHAKAAHGLSRNETVGCGVDLPADWDRNDKKNVTRRIR